MFCDTASRLGFVAEEMLKSAITRLDLLTPGDFSAVARQGRLRKIGNSQDLYRRLEAECAAKPAGQKRTIGF
jgi:hypothetical protein